MYLFFEQAINLYVSNHVFIFYREAVEAGRKFHGTTKDKS